MPAMEERLGRIERDITYLRGVVEQLDKRITELKEYVDKRFNHIETELRELRGRLWWVIGILITMWITIILTVLLK